MRSLLIIFMNLLWVNAANAAYCVEFVKAHPPQVEGRLVSVAVQEMHLDPGGLLGGVHYTEALAASYGIAQIGVRYEDENLKILVENLITGQPTQFGPRSRLSGEVVEIQGEPILLISRRWEMSFDAETEAPGGAAVILTFPGAAL